VDAILAEVNAARSISMPTKPDWLYRPNPT